MPKEAFDRIMSGLRDICDGNFTAVKHRNNKHPAVGDRVRLRGRKAVGTIKSVDDRLWCWMEWDRDWTSTAPKIVHLYELEDANAV
jgi:hypothetical protein